MIGIVLLAIFNIALAKKYYHPVAEEKTFAGSNEEEFARLNAARKSLGDVKVWVYLDDHVEDHSWVMGGDKQCSREGKGGNLGCEELVQWDEDQPDNRDAPEDCALIKSNGKLHDYPCGDERSFVCEYEDESVFRIMEERGMTEDRAQPTMTNNYILEFSSMNAVVTIVSLVLNIILIAALCCIGLRAPGSLKRGYLAVNPKLNDDEL